MTRIDQLPEQRLDTEVSALLSEIEELKTKQFTGSNNLVIHHTRTADTWDIDETVSGSHSYVKWRATFTPTNSARPFTQFQFSKQVGAGSESNDFSAYVDPDNIDATAVSFIVEMINYNLSDANVKLKFAFKSLDTGAITYARIEDLP